MRNCAPSSRLTGSQSPNLSTIAWSDYKNRMKTNPPFESLKERRECFSFLCGSSRTIIFDTFYVFQIRSNADPHTAVKINEVEEVWSATGYAVNSRSPNVPSKLSFSFMSRYGVSLLDLDAVHSEQRAEWIDGISEITRGREMKCPESEGYTKVSSVNRMANVTVTLLCKAQVTCWLMGACL